MIDRFIDRFIQSSFLPFCYPVLFFILLSSPLSFHSFIQSFFLPFYHPVLFFILLSSPLSFHFFIQSSLLPFFYSVLFPSILLFSPLSLHSFIQFIFPPFFYPVLFPFILLFIPLSFFPLFLFLENISVLSLIHNTPGYFLFRFLDIFFPTQFAQKVLDPLNSKATPPFHSRPPHSPVIMTTPHMIPLENFPFIPTRRHQS